MNENIYFLDMYENLKIEKHDDSHKKYISSLVYKSLLDAKNLMINVINFLEKVEEFHIIRCLNIIEIGLQHQSKNYDMGIFNSLNEHIECLINELEKINNTYDLKLNIKDYTKVVSGE